MKMALVDTRRVYDRSRSTVLTRARPIIGITCDLAVNPENGRVVAKSNIDYARCVAAAEGVPMLLPPIPELIEDHLAACDGFVFTGGDDPRMEAFGGVTHPKASPMHPQRQAYETGLLGALERERPDVPVLGVCLGMQLMSLVAGGRMDQHLPDSLATHEQHRGREHAIVTDSHAANATKSLAWLARADKEAFVASYHRQAVIEPGSLRVAATSPDGVIETVFDPVRAFRVGVQWHPERTADANLGQGVFDALIAACRNAQS